MFTSTSWARSSLPPALDGIGVEEKLGAQLNLSSYAFTDEEGKSVNLGQYFRPGKPIVLMLGYYKCPKLCGLILNGFTNTARNLNWGLGVEYDMVMVSIDPRETPELAKKKKDTYVKHYGRMNAESGWHFLTGKEPDIKKLANDLGFLYRYDEKQDVYAHTAVLNILTPAGAISRYLYGIEFPTKDLKNSLFEAADGKIGNIVERILLFCYRYDPESGSYALVASNLMKIFGLLTVLTLCLFLWVFWRKELKFLKGRGYGRKLRSWFLP
ncbi:MAG: SCO family protein [Oligoflexales bacterium]|nr:SCO family protein [Oligoflexales bacterium]